MEQPMEWRQARDLLLEGIEPVERELLPLSRATGRILAQPQRAGWDMPPFDRSPYDGYAFQSGDTQGKLPVTLNVLEEIPAGAVPTRTVVPGTAAKVLTGAPIPPGADAVTKFEQTHFTPDTVTLLRCYFPGENVIRQGEDLRAGDLLAGPGQRVDPGLAGALWTQGVRGVEVYRRPRVGLVTTGSELQENGEPSRAGRIPNSNRPAFEAALRLAGAEPVWFGSPGDDCDAIAGMISTAWAETDLILTTGGVSVGDYDLTPAALERAGGEIVVRNLRMKPGGKCCFGWKGKKLACCLSGNPASAMTCFYAVVLPLLRKLAGYPEGQLPELTVPLGADYPKASPQTRLLRGRLTARNGRLVFLPAPSQGNGALHTLAGANALGELPAGSPPMQAGTPIQISYIGM